MQTYYVTRKENNQNTVNSSSDCHSIICGSSFPPTARAIDQHALPYFPKLPGV